MEVPMGMAERVELALRRHIKCDATGLSPAVASVYLVGFEEAARAAIAAMREPSNRMLHAGEVYALRYTDEDHGGIYTAMIDAALTSSEKP